MTTLRLIARLLPWSVVSLLVTLTFSSTGVQAQQGPNADDAAWVFTGDPNAEGGEWRADALISTQAERTILVYGLGDSIASGHGLVGAMGDCVRAPGAYPLLATQLLADVGAVEGGHFACSGATTEDLPGQVDQVLEDLATRGTQAITVPLVTITIGANDFGWTNISDLASVYCGSDSEFQTWVSDTNNGIKANLVQELRRLVVEGNAKVVLTEYHNPINRESNFLRAFVLFPGCLLRSLSVEDLYLRSEDALHATNSMLNDMVVAGGPTRIRLARVHANFHGHESPEPICGTAPPGIGNTWIQVLDCFHPNSNGAEKFAGAVNAAIRQPILQTAP